MPLTHIFLATDDEARDLPPDENPLVLFPGADFKGYDYVPLATLYAILTKRDYRDVSLVMELIDEFHVVELGPDDGPWLFRVPPAFIEALSSLGHAQATQVASEWASSEELQRFPSQSVGAMLMIAVHLAKQARLEGCGLYVWTCL